MRHCVAGCYGCCAVVGQFRPCDTDCYRFLLRLIECLLYTAQLAGERDLVSAEGANSHKRSGSRTATYDLAIWRAITTALSTEGASSEYGF